MKRILIFLIVAAGVVSAAYYFRARLAQHLPAQYAAYLTSNSTVKPGAATPENGEQQTAPGGKSPSRRGGGPVSVKVVEAKAGSLPILRQSFGYVEAKENTPLASPIAGVVASIDVKNGAEVKQGDMIVTYDSRALEAALAKDKATQAKDQATYENAQVTLTRTTNLGEKGASTQQSTDNAKAALRQAAAALALDRAQIDADMVAISNTRIKAPYDGTLGAITVSQGAYVGAGTAVATIVNTKHVYAKFTLPEGDLRLARDALSKGELTVTVAPTDAANGTSLQTGKVTFIDNQVDQASGTFQLWALIDNTAKAFWPGESVSVTVTAGHVDNLVLVPNVAVSPKQDGMGAFVIGKGDKAELHTVTVALRSNGIAGISKGLKPGDKVVVEGQLSLGKGTLVKINGGKPQKTDANTAKPGQSEKKAD